MEKMNEPKGNKKLFGAVLVLGGGIAGMQAALDLANSGYYVYMAEKKSAIGGTMAQLDKTFPTNDCSMCVISPKLVECGRHLNIELITLAELSKVEGEHGNFKVVVNKMPRYVDLEKCTACGECSKVCPIETNNSFDEGLRKRKAIYKLYPQGMPSAYSIEKKGVAPCRATCPAHVSVQGYIALINTHRYEEALLLFREEHPFPGICGRVCHRPCESECSRKDVDSSLSIRNLHRFLSDYEISNEFSSNLKLEKKYEEKVAIIGSGPAGLTVAERLLKMGYDVTIFEKMPKLGGMMRYGIPEYRLPRNILEHEINYILNMGAEVKCNITFGQDFDLTSLKSEGYKACFIAVGLHGGRDLGIENENVPGVLQGVDFLRDVSMGKKVSVGKRVLVIGGGNVAVDVALTAKRKGGEEVSLICLEQREEMPAWDSEISEAIESDIKIINGFGPKSLNISKQNFLEGLQFRMCTNVFDELGRFNPKYNDEVCEFFQADTVVIAIGQSSNLVGFSGQGLDINPSGYINADLLTLQTSLDWVFAGGDVLYGPKSVVDAVASGKKASESIHRFLRGFDLREGRTEDWSFVRPDTVDFEKRERVSLKSLLPSERELNFLEVSFGYDEPEAMSESDRCLECGVCSECYQCVKVCLAGAVNHEMSFLKREINVGSIIVAPGFTPFNPSVYKSYGYNLYPNVVTSLEFERILSASGPFEGHLVRPSDNREPDSIAWLQCVGSRDINVGDHSYCSSVCCMYTNKQAVIAKEHSDKYLDTAVFYMDMRCFGKDFDRYYERAKNESKVRYIRSRIHTIDYYDSDRLMLRYVDDGGTVVEEVFDMVVLAVGLAPNNEILDLSKKLDISLNNHLYAATTNLAPVSSSRDGVYVCGAFQEPKDIPHSVMEASAAAASATKLLCEVRGSLVKKKEIPLEIDVSEVDPRIGVFVCNCGINIGGIADISYVKEYVLTLPNVVHVEDNLFTCSQDTQDKIKEVIKEKDINRVVVASCSPRTHESLFQETIRDAGLNSYLFEMANIRDQNTWVHMDNPEMATKKAIDLVRMAVAKSLYIEPLHQVSLDVTQEVLVVGGGVAGMESAIGIADNGFKVYLVEQGDKLGGIARNLRFTWQGDLVQPYLSTLIDRIVNSKNIKLFFNSEVVETTGVVGNFVSKIMTSSESIVTTEIFHGATVIATGGKEYIPTKYLYGSDSRVLTHFEFDDLLNKSQGSISEKNAIVFIQCVGSRDVERPYCSKLCCTHSLKSSLLIKEINLEKPVYILYRDIRSYGFREDLYKEARKKGVIFIKYDIDSNKPVVRRNEEENLVVNIVDGVLGRNFEINSDYVVLATAILPNYNKDLYELFKLPVNADGFLIEAHAKLRPIDFSSEGIFMAGLAHYPKALDESISQAKASVSRVMTILSKKTVLVGGVVANVDPDKCAVCLTCARTCPYGIPVISDEGYAAIEPAECHGCGICASECPGKAITLKHFTDKQIIAKTRALFEKL